MDPTGKTLPGALLIFLIEVIILIEAIVLIGVTCQTHNSTLKDKNANQPANQQQEIPTFVGSDGIVRKVSPSAILAEMKRCFPSGLPIPVEPLWPELPPNLQKEERLDPLDGNYQNREGSNLGTENFQNGNNENLKFSLLKDEAENKRVLRSEESALKTNIMATGNHNGQFDVSPRDSVVYAATELDSKKLTDILKELVTKQLRKNATSEDTHSSYTNAGRIQGRDAVQKTYQTDDYPDYEYEDQKLNPQKPYGSIASREEHQFSRNPKRRRPATRRRQSSHIPKPNIQEYDYEELPDESGTPDQKQLRSWVKNQGGNFFGDALQRQIELSDALQSMTKELNGRTDDLSPPISSHKQAKMLKSTPRSNEVVEGYKKMLSMVMELNVNLVQTLEKVLANSLCQKGISTLAESLPSQGGAVTKNENQNPDATSVLLDCVDVLMQQRKNRRHPKNGQSNVFHRDAK
ncbi:Hypothetical protein NTJ_08707 [Nesidiocoris tenuis]|uniref:Uncharacterized protein n=1 Tax=Nesidiocoris tenuis TaxID=355587 RepID=A0ABN7AV67_9HEMI|nr:Hypothetical protein NTJ_08707 [Nesidiocoris tenuis]